MPHSSFGSHIFTVLLLLVAATAIFFTARHLLSRWRAYSTTQRATEEEDDEEEDPPTTANPNPAPPPRAAETPPAAAPAAAGGGGSFNLGSLIGPIALIIVVLVIVFFIWKWWHGLKHDPHAHGSHSVVSAASAPITSTHILEDNEAGVSCDPSGNTERTCQIGPKGSKWLYQSDGTPKGTKWCIKPLRAVDEHLFKKVQYLDGDDVVHEYTFGREVIPDNSIKGFQFYPDPSQFSNEHPLVLTYVNGSPNCP